MRGQLLAATSEAYEAARRIHNHRFDRHPALIARCLNADDIRLAVVLAQELELAIAVRSGGHGSAGHGTSEGGLLIDLSQMNHVVIDPLQRVAWAQPGATNGALVQAAAAHELATTTGTCASVGMGGSTLGGGIGWLMGRFGATVDNVLGFELVTARGELIAANTHEHPDLFWALRGGGGNFGVVTAITYRLHALGPVLGGPLIFPWGTAHEALRVYGEITRTAPDELLANAVCATITALGPALIVQPIYCGEELAVGERLLGPLRRLGPAVDLVAPRSYAEAYAMLSPKTTPGVASYDTAYSLRHLADAAVDALLACVLDRPSPRSAVVLHQVHGAATRVAPAATAFGLREPHFAILNVGAWLEGSGERERAWAHQARARMAPFSEQGVYVNFLGEESEAAVRGAYGSNYERLAAIKTRYDPANVFQRNQNIQPLQAGTRESEEIA